MDGNLRLTIESISRASGRENRTWKYSVPLSRRRVTKMRLSSVGSCTTADGRREEVIDDRKGGSVRADTDGKDEDGRCRERGPPDEPAQRRPR